MWDKITYQFPNFNCATIEVWEWISNFIPHFYNGCNQLSVLGSKLIHFSKRGPRDLGHSWFSQTMTCCLGPLLLTCINTLRLRQNRRHFADDIFKCILLNENVWIPNKISLKFVPKGRINNIPSLVQIMAWRRPSLNELTLIPACMNNYIHYNVWDEMLWSAGWNYFTILKLKWCSCWSLWIDKYFHHTLYWTYNYLSMLWFKLIWVCDYLSMQGFKVNLGMWLLI